MPSKPARGYGVGYHSVVARSRGCIPNQRSHRPHRGAGNPTARARSTIPFSTQSTAKSCQNSSPPPQKPSIIAALTPTQFLLTVHLAFLALGVTVARLTLDQSVKVQILQGHLKFLKSAQRSRRFRPFWPHVAQRLCCPSLRMDRGLPELIPPTLLRSRCFCVPNW